MCWFLFFIFAFGYSDVRYVSQDEATGGDPCIFATPCGFTEALEIAEDGDSIYLFNGVYSSDLLDEKNIDIKLTIEGETRDGVILEKDVYFSVDSGKTFSLSHITVRNTNGTFLFVGSSGLEDVIIEDIAFYSLESPAIWVDVCSTFTVRDVIGEDVGIGGSFITITESCDKFLMMDSSFNNTVSGGRIGNIRETKTIVVIDSSFIGCTIDSLDFDNGGGAMILVDCGNVTISACIFENCASIGGLGGALHFDFLDSVEIKDTEFIHCSCSVNGGAAFFDMILEFIVFSGCRFERCHSEVSGGAIRVDALESSSSLVISDSNFTSCNSSIGGAVVVVTGEVNVTRSTFSSCYAESLGGAIYTSGSIVYISSSKFTSCFSGENGGGIFVGNSEVVYLSDPDSDLRISSSSFTLCEAVVNGGGIYFESVDSGRVLQISSSIFTSCHSNGGDGGGVYLYTGGGEFVSSIFTSCTASRDGGGVYVGFSEVMRIEGCEFTDCQAETNGGGVYKLEGSLEVSESRFDRCVVLGKDDYLGDERGGGGVAMIATLNSKVSDSQFHECYSKMNGGGIFIHDSVDTQVSSYEVSGCTIQGCTSDEGGAGIFFSHKSVDPRSLGGCLEITSSTVNASYAGGEYGGGGILVLMKDLYINSSTFIDVQDDGALLTNNYTRNLVVSQNAPSVYISRTTFSSESSDGSALVVQYSDNLDVRDSIFDGYLRIFVEVENMFLKDSNFTANAGFRWENEDPVFENAVLENCLFFDGVETPFSFFEVGSVLFDNCAFRNISNTVIDLIGVTSRFEIRSSVFRSISSGSGSVVSVGIGSSSSSSLVEAFVFNSTFEEIESRNGSALDVTGYGRILVEGTTFRNGDFQHTGAFSVDLDEVEIKNSRFENCRSLDENGEGGGVYSFREEFSFSVSSTSFDDCFAGFRGGGIYLSGVKSLSVVSVSFVSSIAGEEGGGMYVDVFESVLPTSSSHTSLLYTNFTRCSAGSAGGGIFFSKAANYDVGEITLSNLEFEGCDADVAGSAVFISSQNVNLRVNDSEFRNCSSSSFHSQHYFDEESGKQGVGSISLINFYGVVALDSKIFLKDVNFYAENCVFSSGVGGNLVYDSIFVSDGTKGSVLFSDDTVFLSMIRRPVDEVENKTLLYLKAGEVVLSSKMKIDGVNETVPLVSICATGRAEIQDFVLGREDQPKFSVYSDGIVVFSNCTFEGHCNDLMNIQMIQEGLMIYDTIFNDCQGNIIDTTTFTDSSDESLLYMIDGIVFSNVSVNSPRPSDTIWSSASNSFEPNQDLSIFRLTGDGELTIDGFTLDGGLCEEFSGFEDSRAFFFVEDVRGGITVRNSEFRNNTIFQENYSVLRLGQIMAISTFYFENVVIENNMVDRNIETSYIVSIDFPSVDQTDVDCLFKNCEFVDNMNEFGNGGAVFNRFGYVEFKDCTMVGNSAYLGGHVYNVLGVIIFSGNSLVLTQTSLAVFPTQTGGVHSEGGGVKVLDTTEVRDSDVSCVYLYDGSIQISPHAVFANCYNQRAGGGVNFITHTRYFPFTPVFGGSFYNCSAGMDFGGSISFRFFFESSVGEESIEAIYDVSSGTSTTISGCSSGRIGGAFFFSNINILFKCEEEGDSSSLISFVGNTASYGGGAIYSLSSAIGFDETCSHSETGERKVFFEFRDNNALFGQDIYDAGVVKSQAGQVVPENPENPNEWICFDITDDDDSQCFRNFRNTTSFPHETNGDGKTITSPPATFEFVEIPESVVPGEEFRISILVTDCYGDIMSDVPSEEIWMVIDASNEEETCLKSSVFEKSYAENEDGVIIYEGLSLERSCDSFGEISAGVSVWIKNEESHPSVSFSKKSATFFLEPCAIGYFRNGEEEIVCSRCAEGMYSCIIDAVECKECPDNANCGLLGSEGIVVADEGYWSYIDTEEERVIILSCANGKCGEGNNCSDGYDAESPICAACIDGYAEWSGGCSKCEDFTFWKFCVIYLFLLFLIFQVLSLHRNSQVLTSTIERIYAFFGQSYKYSLRSVYWGYLSASLTPFLAFLTSYQFPSGEEAIGDESDSPFLAKIVFPFSYVFSQVFACPFERGSYLVVWGDYFDISFMLFVILVGITICLVWKLFRLPCFLSCCILKKKMNNVSNTSGEKHQRKVFFSELSVSSSSSSSEDEDEDRSSSGEIDDATEQTGDTSDDTKGITVNQEEEKEGNEQSRTILKEIYRTSLDFLNHDEEDSGDSNSTESSSTSSYDETETPTINILFKKDMSKEEEEEEEEEEEMKEKLLHQEKMKRESEKRIKEQEKIWAVSSPLDFWISTVRRELKYRLSDDIDYVARIAGCQCWTWICKVGQQLKERKGSKSTNEEIVDEHEYRNRCEQTFKVPKKCSDRLPSFLSVPGWLCYKLLQTILGPFYNLFLLGFIPYQRTLISFTIVTYPIILDSAFGYITCMRYQDHYVNVRRSDIECFNGKYFKHFPFVFIIPALYCIFLPLFFLSFMFLNKGRMYRKENSFDERYGTLYLCYRKRCWWYEIFCFARKAVIIFMVNFSTTYTELGDFLFCVFLGGCLVFHFLLRPFENVLDNILEGVALFCLFLLVVVRASSIYVYEELEVLAVCLVFFTFVPVFVILTYLKFRIIFISCLKRLESMFLRKCFTNCMICCLPNIFTCYWCCCWKSSNNEDGEGDVRMKENLFDLISEVSEEEENENQVLDGGDSGDGGE